MQANYRSVLLLSLCQALLLTHTVTFSVVNGLVGFMLAPSPILATLPIAVFVIGIAVTTLPASIVMRRIGRKSGFSIGMLVAATSALVCVFALQIHSFLLLCFGTALGGMYSAI